MNSREQTAWSADGRLELMRLSGDSAPLCACDTSWRRDKATGALFLIMLCLFYSFWLHVLTSTLRQWHPDELLVIELGRPWCLSFISWSLPQRLWFTLPTRYGSVFVQESVFQCFKHATVGFTAAGWALLALTKKANTSRVFSTATCPKAKV